MAYPSFSKAISIGFLVILSFLFIGCETTQLSLKEDEAKLAPVLGVDASHIQFASHGELGLILQPKHEEFQANRGIVTLTRTDLYFITRHRRYLFSKDVSYMPVNEFEGVALLDSQIQLQFQDKMLVLKLSDAATARQTQEKYEDLFKNIVALGVPTLESDTSYVRTGYIYSGLVSLHQSEAKANRRFNRIPNRHLGDPHSGRRYIPGNIP